MYIITISNDHGTKSFEYDEQKSNDIMIEINDCLNSRRDFVTLIEKDSEIIYTAHVLLKSQISHQEKPEVFFF